MEEGRSYSYISNTFLEKQQPHRREFDSMARKGRRIDHFAGSRDSRICKRILSTSTSLLMRMTIVCQMAKNCFSNGVVWTVDFAMKGVWWGKGAKRQMRGVSREKCAQPLLWEFVTKKKKRTKISSYCKDKSWREKSPGAFMRNSRQRKIEAQRYFLIVFCIKINHTKVL